MSEALGCVAAGCSATVEAGLGALRAGGNAVDAAIAASLMAGVAEPLLTGIGGGGIATLRMNGEVEVCDLFGQVPGLGAEHSAGAPLIDLEVDFGSARQVFHVGPASVSVPGMPAGLWAMHARHGRLPMAVLAEPAAQAAEQGVPVGDTFARVLELLWPVQQRDPASRDLFSRSAGEPLRSGDRFRNPDLARTLRRYARQGPELFSHGDVAEAILDTLGQEGRITAADLRLYQARFSPAISYSYRDAKVWLPGPPSIAGVLLAQALRALEDHGPMPDLLSVRQLRFLAHAMDRVDRVRRGRLRHNLFHPAFLAGFLTAIHPTEVGEESAHRAPGPTPRQPGNTTHISVVDAAGNAVSITHSLGETAGRLVKGTGILLNNFLGEPDVNPADVALPPGSRLMTMCCPTLVELAGGIYAMGSGGSSRIRSAILHGLVNLVDHGLDPEEVVTSPRAHVEEGVLYLETDGRPRATLDALRSSPFEIRAFPAPNMFFGGLQLAGGQGRQFMGAGDPRRAGVFGEA